jgi:hypothetical protein
MDIDSANSQKTDTWLQELKNTSFECNMESPEAWLNAAWKLKRAAEEIDTFSLLGRGFSNHTAKGRDAELLLLMPVYRLLMGLSFENLLKGIIVAHGKPAGSKGKLDKSFKEHEISKLLEQLDTNKCALISEEREILKELQQYVIWAGRYPIPLTAKNYQIALAYSSEKHRKELILWERLAEHLKDIGWIKKGDGRKIYLKDCKV